MADTKPTNGAWQDVRVSLGPDAEVTGKLSFATPTRIEGKLKGELRASDLLIIGAQAVVQANVHAEKLIVLGEVRGQVEGASRVEICAGGGLFGDSGGAARALTQVVELRPAHRTAGDDLDAVDAR